MGNFTRNVTIKGKFKNIIATGDGFMDDETGEDIDLSKILYEIYKDTPF